MKDVLRGEIKEVITKFMEKSRESKMLGILVREVNNELSDSNRCFVHNVEFGLGTGVRLWVKCEEVYIVPIDEPVGVDEMIDKAETYNVAKVDRHFIPFK
jgi:hypothetical protein